MDTFQIVAGSTVIDFVTGPYRLDDERYRPAVARLRDDLLAGRGAYEAVEDEIEFHVFGTSQANALANLAALYELLDQAERWGRGEEVAPVLLKVRAGGSALAAPLEAAIYGDAGERPNLPVDSYKPLAETGGPAGYSHIIRDVAIRLRRGELLGAEASATTSTQDAGVLMTATFSSAAPHPSPTEIKLSGFDGSDALSPGYLVLSDVTDSGKLWCKDACALYPLNTGWSYQTESGTSALGGRVLRYTPSSTSFMPAFATTSALVTARQVAFLLAVRSGGSTGSADFTLYLRDRYSGSETRRVTVEVANGDCQIILLGVLTNPAGKLRPDLYIQASTTSGTPWLDIDHVAAVPLTPRTTLFDIGRVGAPVALGSYSLLLRHRALTDAHPLAVREDGSANQEPLSHGASPYVVTMGASVAGLFLMPVGTQWRYAHSLGGLGRHALTATRRRAYLVPQ